MQHFLFRLEQFRKVFNKSFTFGSGRKMGTSPHRPTDEEKRQRVNIARDLLSRFEPDGPKRVRPTDVIILWYRQKTREQGLVQKIRDTKSASPAIRLSRQKMFAVFSSLSTSDLWQLMFCPLTAPSRQGYIM